MLATAEIRKDQLYDEDFADTSDPDMDQSINKLINQLKLVSSVWYSVNKISITVASHWE